MVDKNQIPGPSDSAPVPPDVAPPTDAAPAPRRGPGHRGADMRDTVAEMAERAQIISQEAGSKVAAAMKDVISAAAGIAGFAIESARDLVQYMVKRGQMTPEEADKLIREAEAAHDRRPDSEKSRPTATTIAAEKAKVAKAEAAARAAAAAAATPPYRAGLRPMTTSAATTAAKPSPPATIKPVAKTAAAKPEKTPAKPAAKTPAKTAKSAAKAAAKPAAKSSKSSAQAKSAKKGGKR